MVAIDMEMPKSCYECIVKSHCGIGIADGWQTDRREDDCPLVEMGTCKDCRYICCEHHEKTCDIDEYNPNFYCADFEKRGGENG